MNPRTTPKNTGVEALVLWLLHIKEHGYERSESFAAGTSETSAPGVAKQAVDVQH